MPKLKTVPINQSTLKIQKTPNVVRRKTARWKGRQYGLGIMAFLQTLFLINEKQPKAKKMTDAEIIRQVCVEYRGTPKVYQLWKKNDPILVYRFRSEYNRGRLTPEPPPVFSEVSLSYDIDGDPVNCRFSPPRKMTPDEVIRMRNKFVEKYRKPWELDQQRLRKLIDKSS